MPSEGNKALIGVQSKIERAKKHIAELESAIKAFFATSPYEIRNKQDPQTRRRIYYLSRVEETPTAIRAISGDVIQNIRSALDHLAFQLAGSPTNSKDARQIAFPICEDAAKYKTDSPRKVKGVALEGVRAIDAIQPYKGGSGADLWKLHELNNIDKHRLLIVVGSAYRSVNLGAYMSTIPGMEWFPKLDAFYQPADRMCPLKVGDELFVDLPDAQEKGIEFRFELALHEPGIAEGDALMATLDQFRSRIEDIAGAFAPTL